MKKHAPLDIDGNDLRLGDWVRVLTVPLSVKDMPDETKEAFSKAVGNTFQIEHFDETGCIELNMWRKVSMDTIWLEPYCVRRFRRYKRLSKAFKKSLELRNAPPPPRHEVQFDIRLKVGVDADEFGQHLMSLASGAGFAIWPKERRIKGSIYINKSEACPRALLNIVYRYFADSDQIASYEIRGFDEASKNSRAL